MTDLSLVQLPNDFSCYAPTDPSGDFMELNLIYVEVFGDTYKDDVLDVPADGVVLDIGANIGLFTVFVKSQKPDATVLAFEPMPDTLAALHRNIELHELTGVTVHPIALGAKEDSATFTFFPQAPGNSTRYPAQKNYEIPQLQTSTTVDVRVAPLSTVLAAYPEVTTIDLVKIDVEGAEGDVLEGIADEDWAKIRGFVLETEDIDGQLGRIEATLAGRGYEVTSNHAPIIPKESGLYIVHAVRR